jgi:hypothetical protein
MAIPSAIDMAQVLIFKCGCAGECVAGTLSLRVKQLDVR